ncbi:hypothetical protein PENTCL1PPCAC_20787, partial [Pristionchus entomophagus]
IFFCERSDMKLRMHREAVRNVLWYLNLGDSLECENGDEENESDEESHSPKSSGVIVSVVNAHLASR